MVLDPQETTSDLVRDITEVACLIGSAEVLTSMCACLYGLCAAKDRAARAVAIATEDAA